MKKLFPLALAGLLAACNTPDGYCDHCDRDNRAHHRQDALSDRSMGSVRGTHNEPRGAYSRGSNAYDASRIYAPAYGTGTIRPDGTYTYRPDGTYYFNTPTDYGRDRGAYPRSPASDPLSERPMGSSRGTHNEPLTQNNNRDGANHWR